MLYEVILSYEIFKRIQTGCHRIGGRAEAARNLGLSPQILGRWLKEAEDDNGHAFRGNGTLTPEQTEIRSLKGQVQR